MLNNDYLIKYINFTSSIQTVTVGPGVSPSQRIPKYPVADFTASGELHPALKRTF